MKFDTIDLSNLSGDHNFEIRKVEDMRQRRQMFVCVKIVIIWFMLILVSGCKDTSEVEIMQIDEEAVTEEVTEEASEEAPEQVEQKAEEIYVFVCGEVRNPGVYKLCDGERITHAILAAGGMTDQAAEAYLNQAEILTDGQKIYVPDKEEAKQMGRSGDTSDMSVSDGKVNINTADKSELTQLSGIGASRADAIIAYRETNGAFMSIEDVKKVEGIKDGIFEKIREQIKVE